MTMVASRASAAMGRDKKGHPRISSYQLRATSQLLAALLPALNGADPNWLSLCRTIPSMCPRETRAIHLEHHHSPTRQRQWSLGMPIENLVLSNSLTPYFFEQLYLGSSTICLAINSSSPGLKSNVVMAIDTIRSIEFSKSFFLRSAIATS